MARGGASCHEEATPPASAVRASSIDPRRGGRAVQQLRLLLRDQAVDDGEFGVGAGGDGHEVSSLEVAKGTPAGSAPSR